MNNISLSSKILKVSKGQLEIKNGVFTLYAFMIYYEGRCEEHYALVNSKDWKIDEAVPFRINSACVTSEVFGCEKCDCKWQLDEAIHYITEIGFGIITYHPNHEGLGHGIFEKLNSFNKLGADNTSYIDLNCEKEDARNFLPALIILDYFKINEVTLLGNNLKKIHFLMENGVNISGIVNLIYNGNNRTTKKYILLKGRKPEHFALRKDK